MTLKLEDFRELGFYLQRPVYRNFYIPEEGKRRKAVEGVTLTNNYNEVGFTYVLQTGNLYVSYWDKQNKRSVRLIERRIKTIDDFEKCLKRADKKIFEMPL